MRSAVLLFFLTPLSVLAQDRWTSIRYGPFEVLSNAGDRAGREAMTHLEQLRHVIGRTLGIQEPVTVWPIRVLVFKGKKQPTALAESRDSLIAAMGEGVPPRSLVRDCALALIQANTGRIPAGIEQGYAAFLSTVEVRATRVSVGAAPPPEERTLDWARAHMLATNVEYSGRFGVWLRNLSQAADADAATRNAFGKPLAVIDKEAQAWLTQGAFTAVPVSGKALDPEYSFRPQPVEPVAAAIALADMARSAAAYRAVLAQFPESAEAMEGAGLAENDAKVIASAVATGNAGARALVAAGKFEEATKKNPRWVEPYMRLAAQESTPARRVVYLKAATKVAPRNSAAWTALAEAHTEEKQFSEAARAWGAAERAAANDAERAALHQARLAVDEQRLEHAAAERRRIADEQAREMEKLRNEAMASIRDAENRANRDLKPLEPGQKVEQWWDGPRPQGKVTGALLRVDCTAGRVRLVIQTGEGKQMALLLRSPKDIVVTGGEVTLACGPAKPPRQMTIEYHPKPDPKLKTEGEAAFIELRAQN